MRKSGLFIILIFLWNIPLLLRIMVHRYQLGSSSRNVELTNFHLSADHLKLVLQPFHLKLSLLDWAMLEGVEILVGAPTDVEFEGAVGAGAGEGVVEAVEG